MIAVPITLIVLALVASWSARASRGRTPYRDTPAHYRHIVSRRNLIRWTGGVAVTAGLAYSGIDEAVEEWHTREVKGETSDDVAHFLHDLGERYWFLVWAAFALIDRFVGSSAISRWGRRSSEAMVVGLPVLWSTQRALGAARPSDETHGPRFNPFADDNTASGHTFISAIPWITAARMANPQAFKGAALALSPWVGWSRMNDRKHYLSQVLLGYGIAWTAVETVHEVNPRSLQKNDGPEA